MSEGSTDKNHDAAKVEVTLPGVVEKVIPPAHPSEPEKAQIAVEGADDLYREIRVENTLQDSEGNAVKLKEGAEVEVTIAADPESTVAANHESATTDANPLLAKNKRAGK